MKPVTLRKQYEYIDRLERRRDWLKSRVSVYMGKDASHDKAELSALSWAIDTLVEALPSEDVLKSADSTAAKPNPTDSIDPKPLEELIKSIPDDVRKLVKKWYDPKTEHNCENEVYCRLNVECDIVGLIQAARAEELEKVMELPHSHGLNCHVCTTLQHRLEALNNIGDK